MQTTSILSFFWRHIKPYKWFYLVMLSAPIIGSFYPFLYNYAIKLFIDAMATDQSLTYRALLFPITLFIGIQIGLDLIWRISNIAEWKAEPFVRRSILLSSYNYVQNHPYSFFQNNFTGAISSKLKSILDGYDKFWAEMHHGLLSRILKCTINATVLLFVNIQLGLFVIIWSVIYIPVMYRLSKRLNQLSFIETESRHSLIGQISDKITNIFSIFSFAMQRHESQSLDNRIQQDFIPKQIHLYKYDFKVQIIGGILYFTMFTFILLFTIHLKIQQTITIGDFAFVFGIMLVVAEDIWQATVSLQDFSRAMGDLKSALSVVVLPQPHLDTPHTQTLQTHLPNIQFKDVQFGYDNHSPTFKQLNLNISSGEKVGLVGHSGAGKSTLVNLLLRYFNVQKGDILIDEQSIYNVTLDSLRQAIAVIPQDTLLFHRTLFENIQFGCPNASEADVIAAAKRAHIHEYIMQLPAQYHTYVGERGVKLSGGQRQRIAIARAILKDAPILILDEATSSLDSHTEMLIQDSLRFFITDKNKTVLAIAHRLSTLKHMDRIIVLDKGAIIEQGTHDQLINNPESLYKKLWELQEI